MAGSSGGDSRDEQAGGSRGLQKVRRVRSDPGLLPPSAELTRVAANPRFPGIGLASILGTCLSQPETSNKSLEGETSLEPLTPFRCDKGRNLQKRRHLRLRRQLEQEAGVRLPALSSRAGRL